MKMQDIKKLSVEALYEAVEDNKRNLQSLKLSHALAPIENPMAIRNTRRLVARLLTEITLREKTAKQS